MAAPSRKANRASTSLDARRCSPACRNRSAARRSTAGADRRCRRSIWRPGRSPRVPATLYCRRRGDMSRVPMMGFNPLPNPGWNVEQRNDFLNMGLTAENLADRYRISRDGTGQICGRKSEENARASAEGRLAAEIVPVGDMDRGWLSSSDECGKARRPPARLQGEWLRDRRQFFADDRRGRRHAGLLGSVLANTTA